MPKVKYSAETRTRINAEVRSMFGDTVTRLQLLEYKKKSGIFPVWIYRGKRLGGRPQKYVVPTETVETKSVDSVVETTAAVQASA